MLLEFGRPEKIIAFGLNFVLHTQSLNLVSEERLSCSQTAATQLSRCHTADPAAVKACDADFVALLGEAPSHHFSAGEAENALDVELAKVLGIETQQDLMPALELEESLLQTEDDETTEAANNTNPQASGRRRRRC